MLSIYQTIKPSLLWTASERCSTVRCASFEIKRNEQLHCTFENKQSAAFDMKSNEQYFIQSDYLS
jgi:hypothetical protein